MENVAVLIEDRAVGGLLFGLYEGIPLTQRSPISDAGVMPDRTTLYQTTICEVCSTEADVVAQVRKTVIHEVPHHFGTRKWRMTVFVSARRAPRSATITPWAARSRI